MFLSLPSGGRERDRGRSIWAPLVNGDTVMSACPAQDFASFDFLSFTLWFSIWLVFIISIVFSTRLLQDMILHLYPILRILSVSSAVPNPSSMTESSSVTSSVFFLLQCLIISTCFFSVWFFFCNRSFCVWVFFIDFFTVCFFVFFCSIWFFFGLSLCFRVWRNSRFVMN